MDVVGARAHDLGCILAALILGGLATNATDVDAGSYATLNEVLGLVAALALWWRRRAPFTVAAVTFVLAAAAPMASGAAILGVYVVAAHRRGPIPAPLVGLYLVGAVVGSILFPDESLGVVPSLLVGVLMTFGAFGWGLAVRSRQQLVSALAERAERAEADQQTRVVEARRAERRRIATEMHDVLAHRLSLLSLHAGAIELRPDARPTRSPTRPGSSDPTPTWPSRISGPSSACCGTTTPSTAWPPSPPPPTCEALVAECRAAGMHIERTRPRGRPGAVPVDLGRHAYRIVQEGLTNARKHAPGQPVGARRDRARRRGPAHRDRQPLATGPSRRPFPAPASGLVGLARAGRCWRAARFEHCGPEGDYRLEAWLPWPA